MSSKINKKTNNFSILLKVILLLMFIFLLYILSKCRIYNETYENENEKTSTLPEDSGKCKTKSDIVDFCINYNSCCSANAPTKECFCNHPFVQNCRTNFEKCLNNNPKNLSKNDLMSSCIDANKTCCIGYNNNLSIFSSAFTKYKNKNDPDIKPLCSITTVPDIEQKCLELCTTVPNCVAYALKTGDLVSDYGMCSLYDTVEYAVPSINKQTGKPIDFINDYYTRN